MIWAWGSGRGEEARVAAKYIAKYMNKDFEEKRVMGLHRYDVAQGFQPKKVTVLGPQLIEAIEKAAELMGGFPARVSHVGPVAGLVRTLSGGAVVGLLTGEALAGWVLQSCVAQGVPVKVTDARVIDRAPAGRPGGAPPAGVRSEPPHG